jgi:carbohydrate-selective porin OprB
MNKYDESIFFNAPAIGLIVGNLAGGKDKEKGGSGLISPLGIDLALMLGWTFGIFKTFGFTLTPGIAIGRMGFIVISIGIHFQRRLGFGIIIPIFPIWG